MIYHVADKVAWEKAQQTGFYEHPSLKKENFIHLCSLQQLDAVIERYYKNETDLVNLHVDKTKVFSPLQYDLAASVNEEFPHIYGPLNVSAVVEIEYR